MSSPRRRLGYLVTVGVAAVSFAVAPVVLLAHDPGQPTAAPCYNGVIPGNPYVPSCSLPSGGPRVRGSSPDPNAIIACKNFPGCLSWYINGP